MKFGEVYEILESGGFATRKTWGNVFIWMKPKTKVRSEWCKDPVLKMLADANNGQVDAEQVLCKYDFNEKKVMTGWSPQQDDLSADDWVSPFIKLVDGALEMKVYRKTPKEEYVGDLFDGADVFRKP